MLKGNGKYTISLQRSVQVDHNAFEQWVESFQCDETTTIKDILKWYKKICPSSIRVIGLGLTENIDLNYEEPADELPF